MDEPVQKRSGRLIKLNCADAQTTNSSEKRDRCVIINAAAAVNSMAKSRSLTESSELLEARSKPSSSAV